MPRINSDGVKMARLRSKRRGPGICPVKKGRLLETSLIPNTKLLTANTQDNLSQVPLIAIEPRNTKTNYHNDNVRQGFNCQKV